MHIILVEKNERLLDQYSPLIEGQFPSVAEKIRQQNRGAQLLPDRLSRRAQKGWGLVRHSTIYCVFHCHIPPPVTVCLRSWPEACHHGSGCKLGRLECAGIPAWQSSGR